MMASRVIYPPAGGQLDPHLRSTSPMLSSSPPTRIRTSGIFGRRLSLTAASVANTVSSSSLFGSSPPTSSPMYQQSTFFRSSTAVNHAGSTTNIPSTINTPAASTAIATATNGTSGRQRTRSTSHPPPPKYKSYRTPQLRISLQDSIGNLVLSAPVMAPGESIRGQIHLELPKATPVHSIEVCLIGTVAALDGTRLGSMKTVTILEECKTVATASVTNARTNTTRRHTTPAPTTVTIAPTVASTRDDGSPVGRTARRSSVSSQDRARSPTFSNQSNIIAAAAAATISATGNTRRYSTEVMSRTLSMPSPYYAPGHNASSASLARPVSPTSADLRGRRTSFSANVDMPLGGFGILGGRLNMSMVNISSIGQYALDDPEQDDPSQPEAPSYDPPNYDHIVTTTPRSSTDTDHSNTEPPLATETGAAMATEDSSTGLISAPISAPISSTIGSVDDGKKPPICLYLI